VLEAHLPADAIVMSLQRCEVDWDPYQVDDRLIGPAAGDRAPISAETPVHGRGAEAAGGGDDRDARPPSDPARGVARGLSVRLSGMSRSPSIRNG